MTTTSRVATKNIAAIPYRDASVSDANHPHKERQTNMHIIVCQTVNRQSETHIPLASVSHIINNNHDDNNSDSTTWIHLHSGKSIHVDLPYEDAVDYLKDYVNSYS